MFKPISQNLPARYKENTGRAAGFITRRLAPSTRLRSEVNTLVNPFFSLSKGKGVKRIEYRAVRYQDGQALEAVWRVTPHPGYGYPGPFAHRVHRAVEQLVTERGLPIANPISFSIHDLCRRMGVGTGGSEYRKVKAALLSVKATQVESKGAFYAKAQTRYIDQVFSLYERIIFAGERMPDGSLAEKNLLWLGSWYLESLNNLYVKPLDYRFYLELHTPIARRLYELLGVKFYKVAGSPRPRIRYRYSTLCKLLPLRQHRYRSQVSQQFCTAHRELIQGGFLAVAQIMAISHRRDWYIIYRPGPKALAEIELTKTKKKD